jgi:RNA polymerase sigma factor (sigma-70 family)
MSNAKVHSSTVGTDDGCVRTDGWLLERFAVQRDEAAFALLVQRHGPLVLCACRRVLRHEQDAEDAFQATFLVLARKAPNLCRASTVGPWLYTVADRIAKKARGSKVRRHMRETELRDVMQPERTPDWVWRDLRPVIHEEIDRLPLIYRQLFVSCYLQGKTNEQAAQQFGCPRGTVLSRLARARDRLRSRLSRRGVALSAGLLAALGADQAASATVPATLTDATIRAAVSFAGGQSMTTGTISAPVVSLVEAFLKSSDPKPSKLRPLVWSTFGAGLAILLALLPGLGARRPLADLETAAAAEQRAKAHRAECDRLVGTWKVLAAEFDRQPLALDNVPVSITEDRWTLLEQPAANRFTLRPDEPTGPRAKVRPNVIVVYPTTSYTFDATRDPKTIDLTFPGRLRALGIYAIDGDRLTLCYRMARQGRPTEFATTQTGHTLLFHFQRAPSPQGPARAQTSDEGGQEDRSALAGATRFPRLSNDPIHRGQQP